MWACGFTHTRAEVTMTLLEKPIQSLMETVSHAYVSYGPAEVFHGQLQVS
jgi:hypothetical protein